MNQNDLHKALDAKPGEVWKCRNGFTARIYADDGKSPYVFHGAIKCDGEWLYVAWNRAGLAGGADGSLDLIRRYDWREELAPIWAVLKPEYEWIGMSAGLHWMSYEDRPERVKSGFRGDDYGAPLNCLIMPTPDCPWEDTLTKRPAMDQGASK